MKSFLCICFLATMLFAQPQDSNPHKGNIHGIATYGDGQPAKGIMLTASPLGVALGMPLPAAKTNDAGEFKFQNLEYGMWTVNADDENAGYSVFATDTFAGQVRISKDKPQAELNIKLPPKAGILHIHMTNANTGAVIPAMRIKLMLPSRPEFPVFQMSSYSNHVVLIPSNKNIFLHVMSDGFQEWEQSAGNGKLIRLSPGSQLTLEVPLHPI